jgi:ribosomal protein L37AE/L43A
MVRCPYCKAKKATINPEGLWVCTECGAVIKPLYTRPRPKTPKPIQRPQ